MNKVIVNRLTDFVKEGSGLNAPSDFKYWAAKVGAFLEASLGIDESQRFMKLLTTSDYKTHDCA
jgi:hypothetical protein